MKKEFPARLLSLLLAVMILCPAAAFAGNPFVSPRGSCNSINGTTVIITIFVDDPYHNWDWGTRSEDAVSYFRLRSRLETACNWLTKQAARYGAKAKFYWDWHNLDYLYNWYTSSHNMRDYTYTYSELRDYIRDKIPLQAIKTFYNADNAIFLALYNQDINETARGVSFPLDFSAYADSENAYEILWIMDEDNGLTTSAAGLAHEIMHCCGAVDFYQGSSYTTDAYVKHLTKIRSKDIMFSIDYSDPDHIGESFTDADAYYLGLLSSCPDKKTYGLPDNAFGR